MAQNHHDLLAKSTFSQIAYAADEFRAILPPALTAQLDFDTLALCPGNFVDDAFSERYTDLLYSVQLAGRAAFIYLLFEHQSTVDRLLVFRLWRYMGDIWQAYLKDYPEARHLPVIVPLVLHHSATGWTGPRALHELFDLGPERSELWQALEAHLPRLTFVLDDLSVVADDELRSRAMAALPRLALWALKNSRGMHDVVAALRGWVDVLREAVHATNGVAALSLVMRYIAQVSEADPTAIRDFLDAEVGPEALEAYMTAAEILTQRARDEGLNEGRRQALRSILSEQLAQRFGELPPAVVERLEAADSEELERWAKRIFLATTLEDIFSDH